MKRSALIALLSLGGGTRASSQDGFIVQFDTVQDWYPAGGSSVRQKEWGYLVFGHQISDDSTGQTRCMTYRLDPQGQLTNTTAWNTGSVYDFYSGFIDPIADVGDSIHMCAVIQYNGPAPMVWLNAHGLSGELVAADTLLVLDPADSLLMGIRATRTTNNSGLVVTGWRKVGSVLSKAMLLKVDSTSNVEWLREFGSDANLHEAYGVAQYVDGGYVLTGLFSSDDDRSFLIRTDSVGDQVWRRNYGDAAYSDGAVRVDADGYIYTWSEYKDPTWPLERYQVMLRKWDPDGNVVWDTRTHYFLWARARDFEILPDHSFITCGGRSTYGFIAKYSAEGDSLWSRDLHYFSLLADDELFDVEPTSDGGFVLTGNVVQTSGDPSPGLQTLWVIKTDSLGCVVPGCQNVGVQEYVMDLQNLLRVSPNPASAVVQVALDLPEGGEAQGQVQAQLLDAGGRLVLEQGVQQNLNQLRATLDVSALSAGTYYLHLRDASRWLAGSKVVVE